MDSEELAFKIDQTYKNLLEKFNPTARQLVGAGKAYFKAMQGASSSCKVYLDALAKLVTHCQQNPLGANTDIGSSLAQFVDVFKEVEAQQNNIVKVFYLDFIVPLETSLEKDCKALQSEQKKFSSTQKSRHEAVSKAEQGVRKLRKKKSGSRSSVQKEMKSFQKLEEERNNLEIFLDQSFETATTEERQRYSFVLERLCSIARHNLALHGKGSALLQKHIDEWSDVCGASAISDIRGPAGSRNESEGIYSTPTEEFDQETVGPVRRRSHSLDGFLEGDRDSPISFQHRHIEPYSRPLPRAKSEFSIDQPQSQLNSMSPDVRRSIVLANKGRFVKVTFPFGATAENQLSLEEGDVISLRGERNKGWQFGENQRTRQIGWFPVAYTEPLVEEDSAHGCSYIEASSSCHSNVTCEDSPCSPQKTSIHSSNRGKSLDRLEDKTGKTEMIRRRSTSANDANPRPTSSSPYRYNQQVLSSRDEEGVHAYPQTQRPPSSCFDSENRKTFESYNSHIFLSEDMEEDMTSYEGSLHQTQKRPVLTDQGKYTSFGTGYSLSPSLCRSLTSPELPSCFRKSVSSKDSIQCSDDSGFSNEENAIRQRQMSSPYTEVCSKSVNSWVTDSCADACDERQPRAPVPDQQVEADESSPTFLRYLYPVDKASNLSTSLRHSSSVECLDERKMNPNKKENWIVSAFGTFGRKNKNLVSPCAQKIATQKARKKSDRSSVMRSSSLLCIDMSNCAGSPEDIDATNYEDINYATWNKLPVVGDSHSRLNLPAPPPFDPPPLPSKPLKRLHRQQPHHYHPKDENLPVSKVAHPESSSSGNSSWSDCDSSCMEAYMVVKDHSFDLLSSGAEIQRKDPKRCLARSYTWASPEFKSKKNSNSTESKKNCFGSGDSGRQQNSIPTYPVAPPPKPKKSSKMKEKDKKIKSRKSNDDLAPPLPPRRKSTLTPDSQNSSKDVDIFNYSEYMYKRLKNPDGTCRFDQMSFTTGQKCSAWYDLWGNIPYEGKLV